MISLFRIIVTTVIVLTGSQVFGQSYLKNSNQHIFPFKTIDSEVLSNHIEKIADNTRIIGLGEVSHYTKECYEIKHQIIKKLIEKDFNGLVLEVDFGQALLWNDYVTNGIGDIDKLIAASGWFTYRTQEFKDLLLDIRNYNLTANKPFQVFGMEMTAMNHNLAWLSSYFKAYLNSSEELIESLTNERKIVAFEKHEQVEILSYWNLYYAIKDTLENNIALLIETGGKEKYEIALRIAEITRQYATYISQDEFYLKVEFRDQFSTRNVLWCMDYLGENSKIAIWAHNGHVVKKSVLFDYDILGYYLSEWFDDQYYAIGFTFNEGDFGAFSSNGFKKWTLPKMKTNSLTKDFDSFQSSYLFFDIRSYTGNSAYQQSSILNQELPIRTDISESFSDKNNVSMNINLSNSYDMLIYIEKTNYPTTIEWDR
ncbi:erythromycin esterase family protein [Croceitalea sp. P059]|uniref:erythromycin esterase family protein n=1 Tax=Croceitalea sp. P059 TaxID=3075601 RepID=UPI0028881494|nr:erythromycin esterase family protein [Croceitalea sp. P059]MDT0539566.1 erythromycin esterase family protein [Croceitalea sp. P059]